MPNLRRDPILDRWVIIAEDRAKRPRAFTSRENFAQIDPDEAEQACPFCPGNEHETPPEAFALRDHAAEPNAPGWSVRVVPNKYPALVRESVASLAGETDVLRSLANAPPMPAERSVYDSAPAIGVHDVIIDTPRHVTTVGELTAEEFALSLAAIRLRLQALAGETGINHALVFKNVGTAAGATLDHLHSQLMAAGTVFPLVAGEICGAANFYETHGECLFCRMIQLERINGSRVVAESAAFIAFCPFASRFAYEMWILPKLHASRFESMALENLADLASLARSAIAKIERLFQPPAYNLVFHTSPFDSAAIEHYHWHIEVFPRVTIPAGFEWGSGCAVNPVSPETAAARLREIDAH
jgi:UDPglucose--hexose-1-phosphate uridylyltransferase